MSGDRDQARGGANSRPLDETVAETGPGIPDDAVGPEQRTIPDLLEMARNAQDEAMARKLDGRADASDENAAP